MYYQEFAPDPALATYVKYFWVLEDLSGGNLTKNFKIIPDGIPALIFQDNGNLFFEKNGRVMPDLYIYGQFKKHTEIKVQGNFRTIGVYLEPYALKSLFHMDAYEISDQNIPLEDIFPESILDQLLKADTLGEKIGIISNFIRYRIVNIKYQNDKAGYAASLLREGKSLVEVQDSTNLTERSLERLMNHYIGLTPKVYARIARFQSALAAMRNGNYNKISTIIHKCGYFDQSHFIREFNSFTGVTPKSYSRCTKEILTNFPEWNK